MAATGVARARIRKLPRVGRASLLKFEPATISIWVLAGGLVLYLGIDGGGYDTVVHDQVGLAVWWIVLLGAIVGVFPMTLTRAGWIALGLFAAFIGWTAIAITWSLSSERSLADLALVAGYLGVLILAMAAYTDRERALRHTASAVAVAIVALAALALIARLRPGLFPGAEQTSTYLPGTQRRLAWPLNYWNALGALMALGLPLLLGLATSARTLRGQAAAAAGIPVVLLCAYLTFSRGGALAIAVAAVAFIVLAPDRLPKLATAFGAAAGGAVLIVGAAHRSAIENGLTNSAARHQGVSLLVAIVVVCVGVAIVQAGIGRAVRDGTRPRLLVISPRRARLSLVAVVLVAIAISLPAGVPNDISRAWHQFKTNTGASIGVNSPARFAAVSGNGRYDFWKVVIDTESSHLLDGAGPGTFQLLWLPRAPYYDYVENAHSLYFETLAEVGIVGLVLLVAFLATVVVRAVVLVTRSRRDARTGAAGVTAALIAFLVSAASDWVWQVPVLPVAFLLLTAAVLASPGPSRASRWRPMLRLAAVVTALACVVAIGVPLLTTNALRASQTAAARGNLAAALHDARTAADWQPGAASPQVQIALIDERQGDLRDAVAAAIKAATDESQNWSNWIVLARVESESGNQQAAMADYRRARSLNPTSPLFRTL